MIKLKGKHSLIIHRPITEVFEFITTADLEKRRTWASEAIDYQRTPDGPVRLGTVGRTLTRDRRGRLVETTSEVIECEPNRKLTMRSISTFAPDETSHEPKSDAKNTTPSTNSIGSLTLDRVGDHTRLTSAYEIHLPVSPWYKPFAPFWTAQQNRANERACYKLKRSIEAEVGLPPAKKPYRVPGAWVSFAFYVLLTALVWWVYASYNQLHLATNWISTVRIMLSTMVVAGIIWIIASYALWNSRRSKGR